MTDPIAALRDAATIRLRCAAVTRAVEDGRSGWFTLDRGRLPALAQAVAALTRERFPDLQVAPPGCWHAFAAAGADRLADLERRLAERSPADAARARIDLAVVAALLGAEPGPAWRHTERAGAIEAIALPVQRQRRDDLLALLDQASGAAPAASAAASDDRRAPAEDSTAPPARIATGAEGLARASLHAFTEGVFSADPADPLRVDAGVLKRLDAAALRAVFQAGPANALAGLDARAALLQRLGQVLEDQVAAQGGAARPARLLDGLAAAGVPGEIDAVELLRAIGGGWAVVWSGGSRVLGLPVGDAWPHLWAGAAGPGGDDPATAGWVPLHRQAQWLVCSLVEPFAAAGVRVTGLDRLAGLADTDRGSPLIESGVIVARDPRDLARTWKPSEPIVVEWRALTVTLLDELAALVRTQLGLPADRLPSVALPIPPRPPGAPALTVEPDGSLF